METVKRRVPRPNFRSNSVSCYSGELMDWTGCKFVERVPGKVSGAPVLLHSRVKADAVLESYELGQSIQEIAYSYDLEPNAAAEVIGFAHSHNRMTSAS